METSMEYSETQSDSVMNRLPSSNKLLPKTSRCKITFDFDNIYYDMNKKNLVVVFNHTVCKGLEERKGTEKDVDSLKECFQKLNFEVRVYDDLTAKDIKLVIDTVSNIEPSKVSCIAVIVLSHGYGEYLMASDRRYHISCLWFDFIGKFPGIPKLFFIQACRGNKLDRGMEVTDSAGDSKAFHKIPTTADFLVMYSAVKGYKSWREEDGSWFMQTVCDVLNEHAGKYDILHLMTMVCRAVAYNFETNTDNYLTNDLKAMPQMESTLTKFLLFKQIDTSDLYKTTRV